MKCDITKKEIQKNFLDKLIGTVIKDEKGKKHFISAEAQALYKNDKKKMLEMIK